MNEISASSRYPGAATVDAKKWKTATDFEAMFIHQMFKSMRNTVPEGEEMSNGRKIWTQMLDEQISTESAKQGSLGLAKMIYRELAGSEYVSAQRANSAYRASSMPPKCTPEQIDLFAKEAAAQEGVDVNLVRAVIHQESGGNSHALSSKGAKGLMQLMDGTAQEMGIRQVWSGKQNVQGGTKYLRQLLDKFQGREDLALAAYNAGPGTVALYGGIPPFQETQNYVKNVLEYRQKLSEL
jgi:soluble lytic murein transglycosylase-like protein